MFMIKWFCTSNTSFTALLCVLHIYYNQVLCQFHYIPESKHGCCGQEPYIGFRLSVRLPILNIDETKFAFHHTKNSSSIASFMIVIHEVLSMIIKIIKIRMIL